MFAHERDHRGQFIVVDAAHQHGVELHRREPGGLGCSNPGQHLAQPVVPGDRREARGIERIDTHIQRTDPGGAPFRRVTCEPVAVGRHRHLADPGNGSDAPRDLGEFSPHGRLTAGQAYLPQSQPGKRTDRADNLVWAQFGAAPRRLAVAIGQAIAAAKVADVGERQAQVLEPPAVAVDQRSCAA